jgi:uncharacterized membrane protein
METGLPLRVAMEPESPAPDRTLHSILIVFPLSLLAAALALDAFFLFSGDYTWTFIATWLIGGAAVSGIVAAVFGLRDWAAIPAGTPAKRIGFWHGAGNGLITLLLVASFLARWVEPGARGAILLAVAALIPAVFTISLGLVLAGRAPAEPGTAES